MSCMFRRSLVAVGGAVLAGLACVSCADPAPRGGAAALEVGALAPTTESTEAALLVERLAAPGPSSAVRSTVPARRGEATGREARGRPPGRRAEAGRALGLVPSRGELAIDTDGRWLVPRATDDRAPSVRIGASAGGGFVVED